jgi:hypothetical protein
MMKRQRQSWATRKLPPLTLAELERHLDFVAALMVRWPDRADLLVPIWRRIEREREGRRDTDAIIQAARDRVRRLSDRTEARSS